MINTTTMTVDAVTDVGDWYVSDGDHDRAARLKDELDEDLILIAVRVLVAGEPRDEPINLGLLLLNEGAKMLDCLPRVLSGDAGAAAVVAAPAGGDEVRGLPEQLRRLRARYQVMTVVA